MLSSWRNEGQFYQGPVQSRGPTFDPRKSVKFGIDSLGTPGHNRRGSFQTMSGAGKTPLLFSEKGGKLLQKMATNFGKKQKQQQR